ncbi:OFA family MFS transporter [Sulfuriroseicoccus oceanibius]|uniref:OFA family MFS transporter n=1 Tax=Sulfuriroseicoccus oceanibius TaxID=2707525 RepID=A0A6B3LB65_9BACT|nr:OFA family MFS transporter [Sulfuriroseicoccus oceanibius]QQL45242.1 OFA family MFS transporter [Sulfuriroseicoccus oceanibius]
MSSAQKTKNRWLIAASAVGLHISIGSIYAYSAWKMPLENAFGWSSSDTSTAFSIAIFFLGISAAFLGRFIEKKGASKGGLLAASFFSVGLLGSALACYLQNLYLFFLFFGMVSGIGLGLGYISPVSTLVKWFPDRRGLATGLAIMGFGFGGLVCAKLISTFVPAQDEIVLPADQKTYDYLELQKTAPEEAAKIVSTVPALETYKEQSKLADELHREHKTDTPEYAAAKEIKDGFKSTLVYDKGDITKAFLFLGGIYLLVMVPSALYIAPPPAGYADKFAKGSDPKKAKSAAVAGEMTAKQAVRTPGFYGLWLMLFINVSCGIAVIATAKKMGYEMVRLPEVQAGLLVMGISLFNGLGRIMWASASDFIGRSNTYVAFFAIQIIAFPALAYLTGSPIAFMAVTFIILTCYGGGFAAIPAYISDLFGLKEMPTIHGFILTAWSAAGIVGPSINEYVYKTTGSYSGSLWVFGGAFVVALIISVLMKKEIKRIQNGYAAAETANPTPAKAA